MSSITTKSYEPTERAQQILALSQEAFDGAEEVKKRTRQSVEKATECGRLLLEEQAHIGKTMGKGYWESYFEATFSKLLPSRTAQNWMRLAKQQALLRAPKANTLDKAKEQVRELSSSPNLIRRGMLALHLFPTKEHESTPEAGPTTQAPKLSTHLSIVNRFVAWHAWFISANDGTLTQEQRSQLLKDFAPVSAIIEELRA